ncbi:MAG: monosaccharide transporter substrate-binding protein family [Bryobacterales bacterium]|nr:monosaccharide transporter substrate-binding protein family [Bryobacterales bacterium]
MCSRSRVLLALASGGWLALSSCGPSAPPAPQGTYYLIATNIKLPYWQSAQSGLTRAASQLNVKAELVGPDTYKPLGQHEEFRRVVEQNPSGILISVGDRRLMRADIDGAIAKGIPVFTIDSDAEYSKRLLFVGTDSYKAGTLLGTTVVTTLNGKGNVAVFTMPEQTNLVQRLHGLTDAFASHPNLKVTRTIDIQGDPQVAFAAASQILDKEANKVDAFVCLEAIACSEVAKALSQRKVGAKLVVAMDTDPSTLDWIKKGYISATIAQKPFTMAYVGLRMLADLNRSKPANLDRPWRSIPDSMIPTFVDTGATLVNTDNVDEYAKEINASPQGK